MNDMPHRTARFDLFRKLAARARLVSDASSRSRARACVVFLGLGWAQLAHAEPSKLPPEVGYNYQEIESPRILGNAGAARALANSVDALYVNPAGMAATRVYHLNGQVLLIPEAKRQSYGVGLVDSATSSTRIAGGIAATYNTQDPDGVNRQWADLRFGFAYPFSDQFFLGVGGRYLGLRQDGLGVLGASQVSNGLLGQQIVQSFSFDAGAVFRPMPQLSLAVVGSNLNNPGNGFQPLTAAAALGLNTGIFSAEVDWIGDFTTFGSTRSRALAGVSVLIADAFTCRTGYRYDEGLKSHSIGVGAGYVDRQFGLEFGLRRTVNADAATTLGISFSYHLEATGLVPSPTDTF